MLRANRNLVTPRYLCYLLSVPAFYEVANTCLAVGSTNPTELSRDAIRTMGVSLPSMAEQRRAVEYLDAASVRLNALVDELSFMAELVVFPWEPSLCQALLKDEPEWVRLKHVADWREGPGIMAIRFRDSASRFSASGTSSATRSTSQDVVTSTRTSRDPMEAAGSSCWRAPSFGECDIRVAGCHS